MRYTSDLTDTQWEILKPLLKEAGYRSIEKKREFINAGAIDEDEFLLNRVIERFRGLLDTLHSEHAKKARSSETKQADIYRNNRGRKEEVSLPQNYF
jgi:flagellin-specific chaperone FliS